jgi:hypothetical protein
LGFTCGGENSSLVSLQDFQPGLNVLSVIFPRLGSQPQVSAGERRAQFRDQLFRGIRAIAESLS